MLFTTLAWNIQPASFLFALRDNVRYQDPLDEQTASDIQAAIDADEVLYLAPIEALSRANGHPIHGQTTEAHPRGNRDSTGAVKPVSDGVLLDEILKAEVPAGGLVLVPEKMPVDPAFFKVEVKSGGLCSFTVAVNGELATATPLEPVGQPDRRQVLSAAREGPSSRLLLVSRLFEELAEGLRLLENRSTERIRVTQRVADRGAHGADAANRVRLPSPALRKREWDRHREKAAERS